MLDRLSMAASEVTIDAQVSVKEKMEPVFDAAMQIAGKGSYKKRREFLNAKVSKTLLTMCKEIIRELSAKLNDRKAEVPKNLTEIAQTAINVLKQQLSFLLNNLLENYPTDEALKMKKLKLQKQIRDLVGEWEQDWQPQESGDEQAPGAAPSDPGNTQIILDDGNDSDKAEEDEDEPVVIGDDLENLFQDDGAI
ncbi:gtpase slip-gc [Fusarium austroafricanum]|uniref:Gtpase slip-gc n=1 Tax=Fusarium austroafricanum TaxID=2364996 RepID=A0A8H4JMB9_9HYPO|nr:gtpase slip-gc [Fusarium austroafricanum]